MKSLLWFFVLLFVSEQSHQKVHNFKKWGNLALLRFGKAHGSWALREQTRGSVCKPEKYIPGGSITTVQKIKAPVATLQKTLLGAIAKTGGNVGNAGKIVGVMSKFSDVFKSASKMAPWMGALGAVFGFVGADDKPSAQDAVDATNKAIEQLTKEVNVRLEQMKGYVDQRVLDSESNWITRAYQSLSNHWTECIFYKTAHDVNKCLQRAFERLRAERVHFLLHQGKNTLTRDEIKKLEVTFLTFRDYAMLNFLQLKSLADSFKAEEGKNAKDYYEGYLRLTVTVAKQLADYAKFVNNAIMSFYDKQIKTSCAASFKCGGITKRIGASWPSKRHVSSHRDCYCKMRPDARSDQWCVHYVEVRVDYILDTSQYKEYQLRVYTLDAATIKRSKQILFPLAHTYWKTTSEVVRTYWYENVMKLVPLWEEIGNQAERELKVLKEDYAGELLMHADELPIYAEKKSKRSERYMEDYFNSLK